MAEQVSLSSPLHIHIIICQLIRKNLMDLFSVADGEGVSEAGRCFSKVSFMINCYLAFSVQVRKFQDEFKANVVFVYVTEQLEEDREREKARKGRQSLL